MKANDWTTQEIPTYFFEELESAVMNRKGKKEGGEIKFLCPEHDDHNPSATYNPEKRVWHCYTCGAGGGCKSLAKSLGIEVRVPCTFVRKYTLRGNRFSIKQIWRGVLSVRKQLLIGDKSLLKTYYFSLRFCNYFLKDWKALVLVEMPPFQKRPFVKEKNP